MNDKYIQYDVEYISGVMSLREPQKRSLEILHDIMSNTDIRRDSKEKVLEYLKETQLRHWIRYSGIIRIFWTLLLPLKLLSLRLL